jgi:MFS family permease
MKRKQDNLLDPNTAENQFKKKAAIFLLLLGFVSFFSDFTHEGARSLYGQYLALLGVSAFLVSFIAGLGEFIGHALRLATGYIADKTGKYWLMMILGYSVNLLAIPLLGFINPSFWQIALVLIVLERVGKAIRAPAKSALTSFTAPYFGAGKAFAINEMLDQLGAFLGPLMVFSVLSSNLGSSELKNYQYSFFILGIFAVVTIVILFFARFKYPRPKELEARKELPKLSIKKNGTFIIYLICISFLALGFVDFPFISYHITEIKLLDLTYIPLIYSIVMGIDAISALFFGYLYDKKGLLSLCIAIMFSLFITPLVFYGNNLYMIFAGILVWGICMGAQESIFKAIVCRYVDKDRRASAYGVFGAVFGTAWFIGSTIVGLLYDVSKIAIIIFSSLAIVVSLVSAIFLIKKEKTTSIL